MLNKVGPGTGKRIRESCLCIVVRAGDPAQRFSTEERLAGLTTRSGICDAPGSRAEGGCYFGTEVQLQKTGHVITHICSVF